ncbi:hypothetical protein WH52_06370 [Tenacibaculum holothuriorum]|uniref:YbbR-like domain-containing protein n=2 Tax=Tenacibaculum holothuriorum TaxID=1635173 RepID=A0A1Y2PFL5_9FLAO|nr:hypothetical protein WH52_06370 [Tenacibaculum holothuriorum]
MWLLINLSKKYTTQVSYTLNYINLAQNKIFEKEPLKEIPITIKGTGFKLLAANFSNKSLDVNLDKIYKTKNNGYYLLSNNLKANFQKQLANGIELQQVDIDTLHLNLGLLASKKVPLVADLDLNFQLGYDLSKPILLQPDSINVSGTKKLLDKLTHFNLQKVTLENISENLTTTSKIILPEEFNQLKLNTTNTTIQLFVDKFTEGEFEIPILVKNVPNSIKLNIFPKKIKVVYKVGLKNFNKITEDSFSVECDYLQTQKNNVSYLIPKLINKPEMVTSVRIIPNKIDFLINK